MGSFSIWHWIIFLAYIGGVGWPLWRIVGKLGRHPSASLLLHVPGVNILTLWWLAFSDRR